MEKFFILLAFLGSIFGGSREPVIIPSPAPQGIVYKFWIVDDPSKLKLIPNFAERKSSENLMREHKCLAGINGGFYSEKNQPIGEFISEGRIISKFRENKLFNGFLRVGDDKSVAVDYQTASESARIVLQTGPILIKDSKIINLSLVRDNMARRMVAGINRDKKLVFVTVFNSNSMLDGPLLADTGKWLQDLELTNAVNLDGGGASAFYNQEVSVGEWQPVGSWICLRR